MTNTPLLTPREKEILELSLGGAGCKQIAFQLGISTNTVKKHRSRILEKSGVSNMVRLAGTAVEKK